MEFAGVPSPNMNWESSNFLDAWHKFRQHAEINPIFARYKFHEKAKTKRSKRFLQSREPKLIEGLKNSMIIRGGNTSETVSQALKDVFALKKPNAVLYKRKNMVQPFDDSSALEFFSKKSDCSLFLFGSHNKKRSNNLTFGRMFDFHVLDMFELGIEKFVSLRDVKVGLQ